MKLNLACFVIHRDKATYSGAALGNHEPAAQVHQLPVLVVGSTQSQVCSSNMYTCMWWSVIKGRLLWPVFGLAFPTGAY